MKITDLMRSIFGHKKEAPCVPVVEKPRKEYIVPLSDEQRAEIAQMLCDEMDSWSIKSWYGPGGALVTDKPVPGLTTPLYAETAAYYGGAHFVAESMSEGTARKISEALGFEYQGIKE